MVIYGAYSIGAGYAVSSVLRSVVSERTLLKVFDDSIISKNMIYTWDITVPNIIIWVLNLLFAANRKIRNTDVENH